MPNPFMSSESGGEKYYVVTEPPRSAQNGWYENCNGYQFNNKADAEKFMKISDEYSQVSKKAPIGAN